MNFLFILLDHFVRSFHSVFDHLVLSIRELLVFAEDKHDINVLSSASYAIIGLSRLEGLYMKHMFISDKLSYIEAGLA